MSCRLLTDENFARPVVELLRRFGHDVMTLADAKLNNRGTPDSDVLQLAIATGRILITHDRRDYRRLHQTGLQHPGIVIATSNLPGGLLADRLHETLGQRDLTNVCVKLRVDRTEFIAR